MEGSFNERGDIMDKLMHFFKGCYIGSEKLWKSFWVLGFFGFLFLAVLQYLMMMALGHMGFMIVAFFMFFFHLFYLVSVWRCAPNTDWMGWMYIARIIVVLSFVSLLMTIYASFMA